MAEHSSDSHSGLLPLCGAITYGPVRSRRLGTSLGLNILPPLQKICTFNCPYCQYGFTPPWTRTGVAPDDWPGAEAVAAALDERLRAIAPGATHLDRITFAGHGEPTLHPAFGAVVDAVRAVRDARAPGARLAVLSNATTAGNPAVRAVLSCLDERFMKLDAGDQDTLRHMNASAVDVHAIVAALATLDDIVVQSMFVRDAAGRIDNTTPAAVASWLNAIAAIRPRAVHLYSLARRPAWEGLHPADGARLRQIAAAVRALGIAALVFE